MKPKELRLVYVKVNGYNWDGDRIDYHISPSASNWGMWEIIFKDGRVIRTNGIVEFMYKEEEA